MNASSHWPPQDEPVTPTSVTARLDELGWTQPSTRLLDHTDRHALFVWNDGREVARFIITNLVAGRTIGIHYGTEEAARAAYRVLARRDTESTEGKSTESTEGDQ